MRQISRIAFASLAICLLLISALPEESSAIPYKVEGYLKDENGIPITLANISVSGKVYDPGVQDYVNATNYAITDGQGYFKIWVAAMEPGGYNEGSIITVRYSTPGGEAIKEVTVQSIGAWANLTYQEDEGISGFLTTPAGIAVVVLLIVTAVITVLMFKKGGKEETDQETKPKRVDRRRR